MIVFGIFTIGLFAVIWIVDWCLWRMLEDGQQYPVEKSQADKSAMPNEAKTK